MAQETPEERDQRIEKKTAARIVKWLMLASTGVRYGTNSWPLRRSLADAIELGEWREEPPHEGPR